MVRQKMSYNYIEFFIIFYLFFLEVQWGPVAIISYCKRTLFILDNSISSKLFFLEVQ